MRRIIVKQTKADVVSKKAHEKKLKIIFGVAFAVLLAVVFTLIAIESNLRCKYTIKNNTDKNITNIEVVFEDEAGYTIQDIYDGAITAGQKVSGKFEKEDFRQNTGDLWIYVQFEGENPLMIYDGYLYTEYDGHFELEFVQEDGEYRLNCSSGVGIFGGSDVADIDSKIQLVFAEQDWHYMSYSQSEKKWYPDLDGEIVVGDSDDEEPAESSAPLTDDDDVEE